MKKSVMLIVILFYFIIPSQAFAQKEIPILVYHFIDEYKGVGSKELYVTPKNFEEQVRYLRDHGYTLLTFEQWADIHKIEKPIFITFDDGYKNNLHVFKIYQKLQTQNFKPTGTIFVISDFIGWSNRLSKEEITMLSDSGLISIQSHTATHPDLTKSERLTYELEDSKVKIEDITKKPVIAVAYPYGNFNSKVVEKTKKYYKFGLTTTPALYKETGLKDELYLLPRIYVKYSTTLEEFADLINGK